MNMNKKQLTMLAIGIIAVVGIYFIFFRRKKDDSKKESSFNPDYLIIGEESGMMSCDPGCTHVEWDEVEWEWSAKEQVYIKTTYTYEGCRCPKKSGKTNVSSYLGESSYKERKPKKKPDGVSDSSIKLKDVKKETKG